MHNVNMHILILVSILIHININMYIFLFRRDQVNLLVYGPDRPYFKQKQKNIITKF